MRQSNRLVEGVGITDVDYSPVATNCPFYKTWQSMLKRCYNAGSLTKNPTYAGCSVDPYWHRFSIFRRWMAHQDWQGKQLDKDLLVPGNRVYGPVTCIFVTQEVNGLLAEQSKQRGLLPLGVTRHDDKFKVTLKKRRKTHHVGVFETVEEAATAYSDAKAEWIESVAARQSCPITQAALIRAATRLRNTP
jgi:hypothetical protein